MVGRVEEGWYKGFPELLYNTNSIFLTYGVILVVDSLAVL